MDATSSRPVYVVDASVAVKWLLRDEPDTSPADLLLADYREGWIELIAPAHFRYEVPSAVRNALRTGRVTSEDGRAAIVDFCSWRIPTVDDDALIEAGYLQALRFGCSLYDGLYLALAHAAECPLVHADGRLRNALGARYPRALWFSDYVRHGRRSP